MMVFFFDVFAQRAFHGNSLVVAQGVRDLISVTEGAHELVKLLWLGHLEGIET